MKSHLIFEPSAILKALEFCHLLLGSPPALLFLPAVYCFADLPFIYLSNLSTAALEILPISAPCWHGREDTALKEIS